MQVAFTRCSCSTLAARSTPLPLLRQPSRTLPLVPTKRRYATPPAADASGLAEDLAKQGEAQTNKAERLLKRFWKAVNIEQKESRILIQLDKRALKTPSGKPLSLPQERYPLAVLIALEWDNQQTNLKPHALPLTSLASRALDGLSDPQTRKQVTDGLMKFLHTDTICAHQDHPESLVALQNKHWLPLIDWVNTKYDLQSDPIKPSDSLFNTKQAHSTEAKLRAVVDAFDPFKLAAFERAVLTSKSFCISLGLVEGHLSVEEAAQCAHVEVQSQIDRWGEVEDTHDVDNEDVRTRLGSAALLIA